MKSRPVVEHTLLTRSILAQKIAAAGDAALNLNLII